MFSFTELENYINASRRDDKCSECLLPNCTNGRTCGRACMDGPRPVQAYRQTDIIIPRVRFAQRRKEGKKKKVQGVQEKY